MNLPLDAKIKVIARVTDDFINSIESGKVPEKIVYKMQAKKEDSAVMQSARVAALNSLVLSPMTKFAFDTRRVDQEGSRNPRKNLQYWHRSDQFIDSEDEVKIKIFSKLANILQELKDRLGKQPEWFESYARQLYDNVFRILRVKEADLDIFRPQMSYLEQLIFARYRLTMENLEKYSSEEIENQILKKDEELIGRNNYLKVTGHTEEKEKKAIVKDSLEKTTQESIVNAIFGANNLRKDGERTVERTITITIKDNVVD